MTLLYQPKEGSVLICDFRGYEVPEIIKIRPFIVIRRHRTNKLLVTVVPLSTTAPQTVLAHHLQLESEPSVLGEMRHRCHRQPWTN